MRERVIVKDCTSAAQTVNLPVGPVGARITIVRAGTNTLYPLNIVPQSGAKIGQSTATLALYDLDAYITLVSNGADWSIAGRYASKRIVAIDSNTVINWTFDSDTVSYTNAVTGGQTATLTTQIGSNVFAGLAGIQDRCVYMNSAALGTGAASSTSTVEPTASAHTLSAWIKLQASPSAYGKIFGKVYRNNGTWTEPYVASILSFGSGLDGTLESSITVSGTRYTLASSGIHKCVVGQWCHVAHTYDGTTLKLYLNGNLANSRSVSGTIDFGTHGPWIVGGNHISSSEYLDAFIDDCRAESVVRDATYLRTQYKSGLGLIE